MIVANNMAWRPDDGGIVASLKEAYLAMTRLDTPVELMRVAARLDETAGRTSMDGKLALVAQADEEGRTLAAALLEETDLAVVECASAEAALAILMKEADRTAFLLADHELAGVRDASALTAAVRKLWPGIHIAVADLGEDELRRTDQDGIARLSRPWRGLDVLIEADRALARAA